jgi:hypothetical protein
VTPGFRKAASPGFFCGPFVPFVVFVVDLPFFMFLMFFMLEALPD